MFSTLAIITPGRDNGILVGSASRPTLESNSANSSGFSFMSTNFFNHSIIKCSKKFQIMGKKFQLLIDI